MDRTIDAQPFLGQLVADPQRARPVRRAVPARRGRGPGRGRPDALPAAAAGVPPGAGRRAAGHPAAALLAKAAGRRARRTGRPISFRAGPAEAGLRRAGARRRGDRRRCATHRRAGIRAIRHAHVRITGPVALADEEFATVAQGAVAGTIGSVVLITLWLFLAVRTWRLIVPDSGHAGAGADADRAVRRRRGRHAQPHLGRLRHPVRRHRRRFRHPVQRPLPRIARVRPADPAAALRETARRVGPQILIAAAATAAGFLAFVPDRFQRRRRARADRRRRAC